MLAGASVAVSAGANLVVKGAIDLVLLCTENGGEIVGHGDQSTVERVRGHLVWEERSGGEKMTVKGHDKEE